MERYTALNKADRRVMQKPFFLALGLILIISAVSSGRLLFGAIGLFVIFVAMYKRTIIADETGITAYYDYLVYKTSVTYSFEEISNIIIDAGMSETVMAFIRKGTTTFALFRPEDAEKITDFAQKSNGRIKVDYARIKNNKKSL